MGNSSVAAKRSDGAVPYKNSFDPSLTPGGKRFRMKEGFFTPMAPKIPTSTGSAGIAAVSSGGSVEKDDSQLPNSSFRMDTSEDEEEPEEPKPFLRPRRKAISGEAEGEYNPRRAGRKAQTYTKTPEVEQTLTTALRGCPFFTALEVETMEHLVSAMPIKEVDEGDKIIQQGELGDSAYVLLSGECYICDESGKAEIYNKDTNDAPSQEKFRRAVTTKIVNVPDDTASTDRLGSFKAPRFFGEIAMLWGAMRTVSVYAAEPCVLAILPREDYTNLVVLTEIEMRNNRTEILRKVKLLETLQDEQITQLADALEKETYEEGEVIIKQGEAGKEFFVVESGECKATVSTGAVDRPDAADERVDVQEHRRYGPGELFGEKALLRGTVRAATITATCRSVLLKLTNRKFERLLGSLNELGDAHYITDPRKDIAEFYRQGDAFGPFGSKQHCDKALQTERFGRKPALSGPTDWFCVYRPTSRDAISKLLSGNAVGKGLNVKGKSAKRGRLSGFVPFLQVHDNNHKKDIEESPEDSWIEVFYESEIGRTKALAKLRAEADRLKKAQADGQVPSSKGTKLAHGHGHGKAAKNINKDPYAVTLLNGYSEVYGLEVPERVLREVYIIEPDLTFLAGWETGRNSEPAFMDMNLHALRDGKEPKVVLYQFDKDNPMNPQGLLIAYAEGKVKPVVSDFDTFLVGSRGVIHEELSAEQASIASWSLDNTLNILHNPGQLGWNSRWLEVIAKANEEGFHPEAPKYGFGDPMSYRLTTEVVKATIESGAVRHGAECFNFFFPQELDDEYLVVWENFPDKPWTYLREEPLREFLLERVSEGFSFPLNPVWPVRDPGWYKVFEALQGKIEAAINLDKWMPPKSRLMEKIQEMHRKFPEGFCFEKPELKRKTNPKEALQNARMRIQAIKRMESLMDVQACEHADYLEYKMKSNTRASLKGEEQIEKLKAAGQLASATAEF